MALDELLISTGVDALIKLVRERGKIEIRDAARMLGVPVQSVEDWAKVLEAENLIKIQYQLTQVMLVWTPLGGAEREKKAQNVNERKTQTVQKMEGMAKSVSEGRVELSALQEQLRTAQTHTQSRLQKLSADLLESQKLDAQLSRVLSERQAGLGKLKEEMAAARTGMEEFQKGLGELPGQNGKSDSATQMKKLSDAEERLEGRLKTASELFDSVQEEVRGLVQKLASDKTMDELAQVRQNLADLQFARAEMEKTGSTLLNETKMMGEELERLSSKLNLVEARKSEKANPKKMLEETEGLAKKVQRERDTVLGELEQSLAGVKKQVQAYSQTQYQFQALQGRVESLRSSVDKGGAELDLMEQTLTRATKTYSEDLEGARTELAEEKKEFEEMTQKARDVQEMLSHVDEMAKASEQLESRLRGLIKEAQVYSVTAPAMTMAAGGAQTGGRGGRGAQIGGTGPGSTPSGGSSGSPSGESLPPELERKIALSSQDEEEFEKKRQEMALLVKKMWDEDRKPKGS